MELEELALKRAKKHIEALEFYVPKLAHPKHFGAAEKIKYKAYKAIEQLRMLVQIANAS